MENKYNHPQMKKIAILILMCFFATFVKAQSSFNENRFRIGFTTFSTLGNVKPEQGISRGIRFGGSFGLVGDLNLGEHIAIGTGLNITTINGKTTEINAMPYHAPVSSVEQLNYDITYKLKYLEIPLNFKIKLNKKGDYRWFGQTGLTNGFKLKARQDATRANTVLAEDVNAGDWTRFYRGSLTLGAGAEYDLARKVSLVGALLYNKGLSPITDSEPSAKNNYVALQISLLF